MKRKDFLAITAISFVVMSFIGVPAFADVAKSHSSNQESLPENITEKPAALFIQSASDPLAEAGNKIVAADTASDKNMTVSPDAAVSQTGKDTAAGVLSPASNSRAESEPAGSYKKEKNNAPLNENSYASNETALKAIGKNVVLFKDKIKERFSVYLERSAKYIEIMKEVLREKKLPEELVFLPIVESGFNPNAYSRARAVGPWQFISGTAKRYGLVIDWWRDERKDPVKSTVAAAEYLKDLYKMFGSWNLALAAYNAGEGKISKALKRSYVDDYWSLLNTKQIRNETKEYVPRYIAAAMIANTPEEYGFSNLDYHDPLEYDELSISSPLDIEVIAKCAECTANEISELNPELRRWSTPPNVREYTIRIPAGSKDIFLRNLESVPKKEQFTVDYYTLKKGDTIKKIAKKTGVASSTIVAMNSLSGVEHISPGNMIALPPKGKYSPDPDDRAIIHKAAFKKKLSGGHVSKKSRKGTAVRSTKVKTKAKAKHRTKTNRA
ncbi:MAG: transglycosylase SLT domain-containing protein [Nitrospirae bacterium]|nr:transglycosylase SLT domain-containing protein [Nitrospirota bacterium]